MSGSSATTARANTIASRTFQSGGSLGGDKKPGIFGGSISWPRGNLGNNAFRRAPQSTPTVQFSLLHTTRTPFQRTRARAIIY